MGNKFTIFIYRGIFIHVLTFIIRKIYMRVLQCSLYDYIKKSKKYASKNYLKTNVTKDQVPFSCRKCDYVSLTLKIEENH